MRIMIVILLAVSMLMSLYYTCRLFRLDEPCKLTWLIVVTDSLIVVSLVFLVARWDIAGYYTRQVLFILFIAALLWSLRAHLSRPWRPTSTGVFQNHWSSVISQQAMVSRLRLTEGFLFAIVFLNGDSGLD